MKKINRITWIIHSN